jgi:metallo-beta-lactamase family protein
VNHLPGEKNLVMMTGYQAVGTRGRALLEGANSIRIFGQQIAVRAEVHAVHGMSGHADAEELLSWLAPLKGTRRRAFVVHGEPRSADVFAARLRDELGWDATAPALDETVEL